jgi:hypothetical protein
MLRLCLWPACARLRLLTFPFGGGCATTTATARDATAAIASARTNARAIFLTLFDGTTVPGVCVCSPWQETVKQRALLSQTG